MRLEMSMVSDVAEKRGAPMIRCVLPSLKMIEGTIELKRAVPGAIEPARPGRGSNTPMQPLYMKPRPDVITPDGMPSEWVIEKQLPSLSRTEMCVVSLETAPELKRGTSAFTPRMISPAMVLA